MSDIDAVYERHMVVQTRQKRAHGLRDYIVLLLSVLWIRIRMLLRLPEPFNNKQKKQPLKNKSRLQNSDPEISGTDPRIRFRTKIMDPQQCS
jgi:hypothetical protein